MHVLNILMLMISKHTDDQTKALKMMTIALSNMYLIHISQVTGQIFVAYRPAIVLPLTCASKGDLGYSANVGTVKLGRMSSLNDGMMGSFEYV